MSKDFDPDKDPSLRDALFSDSTVANIRCAIKWFSWQIAHVLAMVVLAILASALLLMRGVGSVVITVGRFVNRLLPTNAKRQTRWMYRSVRHSTTSRVSFESLKRTSVRGGEILFDILFVVSFVAGVVVTILIAYANPIEFALVVGGAILAIGAIILAGYVAQYLLSKVDGLLSTIVNKSEDARRRAVETPGVRRVYGKCPVTFGDGPSWFEAAVDRIKRTID